VKPRLILELTPRTLERVESDVAVAGFFNDERPLRGGAARADWRLCGGLSKRIERGDLSGESGEAFLIGCGRALRSPRLLVVGLGGRREFDLLRLSDEIAAVIGRCNRLRCSEIAMSPLGVAPDDLPRHAAAVVTGIREAYRGIEGPMRIHLCIQPSELSSVRRAFEEACKGARVDEIEVRSPNPPSSPTSPYATPAALERAPG
jgi:hypothetical protein